MTTAARKITSIPVRFATDTWQHILDLVAPTNEAARTELAGVTGLAASLITREAMRASPIIVAGDGPQLRIYCVYGEEAVAGDQANEAALPASPAEKGAWTMSLPCPTDDLNWVRASLKKRSTRITARDVAETALPEPEEETRASNATINVESFLRP